MSQTPIIPQSDFQRLVLERALAFAQHLEHTAATAPHGHLLDRCELASLQQGRQLLRDCLAAALQQQIAQGEKRGRRPASAQLAQAAAATKAPTPGGS